MIKKIISTVVLSSAIILSSMSSIHAESSDSKYRLSEQSRTDFEDGAYTGVPNAGWIRSEAVDDGHGNSILIGADSGFDISREGAWIGLFGNKRDAISAYEFDLYSNEIKSGNLRLMFRGPMSNGNNATGYIVSIEPEGIIKDADESAEFSFNEWHRIRFLYDSTSHTYSVYMDDMSTCILTGSIHSMVTGIDFMRVTLWAEDTYAAIDNFTYYSAYKLPDGYTKPVMSLKQTTEKILESEAGEITADIDAFAEIAEVKFYVDGTEVYTATEEPYVLSYIFTKGNHTVRAVAKDIYDETAEDSIDIISYPDTKPRIIFGFSDGRDYERAELNALPITVSMSGAELEEASISVDGAFVDSLVMGENTVNLSGLAIGTHLISVYAKNTIGEEAQAQQSITVCKTFDDVIWSADYDDGNANGTINGEGQFYRLETIREDFGKSMLIGANTVQDISKEGAWTPLQLMNTTTTAIVDFDIYFNNITGNGMFIQLIPAEGAVRPKLVTISSSTIASGDNSAKYEFDAGQWYHITLTIDAQKRECSLYLDNNKVFEKLAVSNMPEGASMNSLRLISQLQGDEETYFAIDNAEVRQLTTAPYIINITSENGSRNVVSDRDTKIKAYFSGALQEASVYPSKFTLDGANIIGAEYNPADFSITLTLDKPLNAGLHRLTAASNLVMGSNSTYDEAFYSDFTVKTSIFSINSAEIKDGTVNTEIENTGDNERVIYLIVNTFDEGTLKSSVVKEFVLTPGINSITYKSSDYEIGGEINAYIWDSLSIPSCLAMLNN
ncbi:MAG: hypothetical protein J6N52_12055 [Clostridia bacterium]|nr:hypothetical protein [Clostridia bacterium]